MGLFDMLGVLLGLYTLYAAATGAVYARSGAWGRRILREDEPRYFWVVIAIYVALSTALLLLF